MEFVKSALMGLWETSGIALFLSSPTTLIMVGIACVLLYLAIVKGFEPLLLLPIAFGMLLTNLLGSEVFHEELFAGGHVNWGLFGGTAMLDGTKITDVAAYWVNAAGNIFTVSGNELVGHFVNAVNIGERTMVDYAEVYTLSSKCKSKSGAEAPFFRIP